MTYIHQNIFLLYKAIRDVNSSTLEFRQNIIECYKENIGKEPKHTDISNIEELLADKDKLLKFIISHISNGK